MFFHIQNQFVRQKCISGLYLATVRRLEMSRRSFKAGREVTRPSSSWF